MSQSLAQVYLHLIYHVHESSPRFPAAFLEKLHQYHAGFCKNHNCPPLAVGGTEDHIHILCRLSRTLSIAEAVQQIKKTSSCWIKQQYTDYPILSKFHWQNGYGAFSVSHSNIDCVKNYIVHQCEHHKKMSFREEYLLFLQKHNLEYNEQYLWD